MEEEREEEEGGGEEEEEEEEEGRWLGLLSYFSSCSFSSNL